MPTLSFIHAADLHLDSPFRGLCVDTEYYPHITKYVRNATTTAFNNLVTLAIERNVEFLVISGDVYDAADQSARALLLFRDGTQRLSEHGIQTFIVHGNHDPLTAEPRAIDWPDNVHIFGPRPPSTVFVEHEGRRTVAVSGVSHDAANVSDNLAVAFQELAPVDPQLYHIAALHCTIGSRTGHDPYAPCTLDDLANAPIDYWAVGHVHSRNILSQSPYVVYPGNSQGLHIREPGPRGCYLVTVDTDTKETSLEFCPLDAVRWHDIEVEATNITTFDKLESEITTAVDDILETTDGRPLICRVILTGRTPLFHKLQGGTAITDVSERLRETYAQTSPFVWIEQLTPRCQPDIDLEERRQQNDLLGRVLTTAAEYRDSKDLCAALKQGPLATLHDHTRARQALDHLSDDDVKGMLHDAERICLDLLEEETE